VNEQIAIGASALMVSLAGLTAVMRLWPAAVRGRHRAPQFRPVEAHVQVTTHCQFEHRDTVHVRTRVTGELICRSCGHFNTTPGGLQ